MQERNRKTNQQKKHPRSVGTGTFDQRGKTAWRATGVAARTAGSTPSAPACALAHVPVGAPLRPARTGLEAAAPLTGTCRTDPDFTVINATSGMAT